MESHRRFAEKYDLHFHLLADRSGEILKQLGVAGPLGIARRSTIVIDKSGVVRHVYEDVKSRGHAEEVLAAVREM